MNTRTRTNLYVSKNKDLLLELINSGYKSGTVGIVYDDEVICKELSKALLASGNGVRSLHLSQLGKESFDEHIRFFIGVGSRDVAKPLRKMANQNRFCFYCLDIAPEFFGEIESVNEKTTYAEFAYFDTTYINIKDTENVSKGYSSVVSLLISLLNIYCADLLLPYRDTPLYVLIGELKAFLFKETDSDLFLEKMLRLIKNSVDYLNEKSAIAIVYHIRKQSRQRWSSQKEFLVSYLLFYFGLIFTKWNFNDMLIPAAMQERNNDIRQRVLLQQSEKINAFMLTRHQLNHLAMVYRAQGNSFENINVIEVISLIIKHCNSKGIIGEINNMGVIERLINYEEYKGY